MSLANNLTQSLSDLATILHEAEISYCLVGGLAVSLFAAPRATEDIELLVMLSEAQKKKMPALLATKFIVVQDKELFRVGECTIPDYS